MNVVCYLTMSVSDALACTVFGLPLVILDVCHVRMKVLTGLARLACV